MKTQEKIWQPHGHGYPDVVPTWWKRDGAYVYLYEFERPMRWRWFVDGCDHRGNARTVWGACAQANIWLREHGVS